MSRTDKLLSLLLGLLLMAGGVALYYTLRYPKYQVSYTEFYLLGPTGKAEGYPRHLVLGEEAQVIVGVKNRETEAADYRVEVVWDGERVAELAPGRVRREEEWRERLTLRPRRPGPEQKAEILLYKAGTGGVYRSLTLWIDVIPPRQP